MTRTVYVNGSFCAADQAKISIFDRGFLFADAVYEVIAVLDGKLVNFAVHMRRLRRSLGELNIPEPLSETGYLSVMRQLVSRNELGEGLVYLEISRGVADREFLYPDGLEPTVVMFTQVKTLVESVNGKNGVKLKSAEDIRWARRDIKSTGMLAQVMAKQAARLAGAHEAIMVADGYVTEGGSCNIYIVKDGVVFTRHLSNEILAGITRASLLSLARDKTIKIDERPFSLDEAYAADEMFTSSASTFICPVVSVDDRPVNSGVIGPVVRELQAIYVAHARRTAV
jgi:D-alanine transaminase